MPRKQRDRKNSPAARRRTVPSAARPADAAGLFPEFPGTKDIVYHPVFKGRLSKWVWRFYTHRLTRAGRWFLSLTVLLGTIGSTSLEIQTYIPFLYAAGLWGIAFAAMLFSAPHVRLRARHADRIVAGETLPVDVEIEQMPGRRWFAADVNVLPSGLPPAVDAVPPGGVSVGTLERGRMARVRLGLACPRRGVYPLRGYRVETDFPLGLLNAYRIYRQEATVLVYPAFTRLVRLALQPGRRYHPGGVALASQLGDSFEYLGNREYREGDNIRDIDWRATARMAGTPILREWREEYFLRVAVVLDTHIPRAGGRDERQTRRDSFERAVSVCAAVSDYMARQEYIVDLFAAGPNLYHLTAGRNLAYLDQILDILACVEENPDEPFTVIEPQLQENISRITAVVCVFLDWNETRRAFVEGLRQNGAGVKVIVVRDTPTTLPVEGARDDSAALVVIDSADFASGLEEM